LCSGKTPAKRISIQNHAIKRRVAAIGGSILQNLSGVHVAIKAKTATSLLCNSEPTTSGHLNLNTKNGGTIDGLLDGARGIPFPPAGIDPSSAWAFIPPTFNLAQPLSIAEPRTVDAQTCAGT
jgi:hypothetical protein